MPKFFGDNNPDISDEILINIFSYLGNRALTLTVPRVSKNWLTIVNAKSFNDKNLSCILKRIGLSLFSEFPDKIELISSGYTNKNYKITTNDQSYVLRIPIMKDHILIDRYCERFNTEISYQLGLGAALVCYEQSTGIMLTKYIASQNPLTSDLLMNENILRQVAQALKILHRSNKEFIGNWLIFNKIKVLSNFINGYSISGTEEILVWILNQIILIEDLFEKLNIRYYSCHNDLSQNNFLLTIDGIKIIDWEFSGRNDNMWDLAFLSVVSELDEQAEKYLLDSYFDSEIDELDFCRFLIYKPIAHFWIGLLSVLQIYNCNSKLGKTWLTEIAINKFNKAKNAFGQLFFQDALNQLVQFTEASSIHLDL